MQLHEGQIAVIGAGLELHKTVRQRLENELAALRAARVPVSAAVFAKVDQALAELNDALHGVVLASIGAH